MISCGHCECTGFVNLGQIPESQMPQDGPNWHYKVLEWISSEQNQGSDVQVCTCCGDGETWRSDCPGYHDDDDTSIECL